MTNTNKALPLEIQLCHQLYLQLLAKHGLTEVFGGADAIKDEISKSRIRIEKKKRELDRAKETEKQNDAFQKKHEQNQKSCKK